MDLIYTEYTNQIYIMGGSCFAEKQTRDGRFIYFWTIMSVNTNKKGKNKI